VNFDALTRARTFAMTSTVLVTGFEPFDGRDMNPSWEAVVRLAESWSGPLHTARLPCVFGAAIPTLQTAIEVYAPDLVVCVGQAGGRHTITPERVAINVDDARIPDNAGNQPVDVPVVADGPAAYFTRLPVKACVTELRSAGIPATVSQSAGTFVCNHVFYGLMHLIATRYPGLRGGFVHVPYAPQQVVDGAAPSMSIDMISRGLALVLRTSLNTPVDVLLPDGALS
jgi:pyroglutamyl-peptidase